MEIDAVASLLRDFIERVERKAADALGPNHVPAGPRREPTFTKDPTLAVYRECLAKLADDDRAKLREIIETMRTALSDPRRPPGAPRGA
jgi:hypothetical protein